MQKWKLTCNDAYKAMIREDIKIEAPDLEAAFRKAKAKFCRRYKTEEIWVDITSVQEL